MEAVERSGIGRTALFAWLLLGACAGPAIQADVLVNAQPTPAIVAEAPPAPVVPAEPLPSVPPPVVPFITCNTTATQGGAIVCVTNPGAEILQGSKAVAVASDAGVAVVGLRRDAAAQVTIGSQLPTPTDGGVAFPLMSATVDVAPRVDTIAKLSMECNKIAAQSPAEKRHAEVSWVKKDKALQVFSAPVGPVGFIKPAEGPYSSPFGATRTYVPKTKDCEGSTSVHNGQDIAIATGTDIRAPMAGTVLLADPDLYYEGGAVFLDMGYGLVSVTMHMSRIDVKAGDVVKQGGVLGLSGSTGRVTGPHLHWAIKYRDVHSGDRGTDIWLDPVLMLGLHSPD